MCIRDRNLSVLLHDVATFNTLLSCPLLFRYSNLFCNGGATIKFFHEKCRFCDFNWLPWQRLLGNHQISAGFIKPLYSFTNPCKVCVDPSTSFEELVAPRSTIKILQQIKKQEAFEKMLGTFAAASRRTPHCHSPGVTVCASVSTTTTTTTTTTRDRGDRYGPIEWAQ